MKRIFFHIGLMIIAALAIVWLTMLWLNSWTRHDETVQVPVVKNLSYPQALRTLNDAGLVAVLSDSVYDKRTKPGTVIEQNPKGGTLVKEGREIYLSINAFSPKMVSLPVLTDLSVRSASSILEGLEIKNVTVRRVPSEFKDLVLGVYYKGRRLYPGARVPVNARLELEVGEGLHEIVDSIEPELSLDAVPANETLDLF